MNAERDYGSNATGEDVARRAGILSALGDANRLAVIDLLQGQDLSPDALGAALGMPGNLLAHHLKVLEGAGLITRDHSQNDRRRTYVHFVAGSLEEVLPRGTQLAAHRIVFVCTHNSARSVLADALWRDASAVPSTSAGTHPADEINPRAQRIAQRCGLTIAQETPQSIDDVLRRDDLIVSVCDSVNEQLGPLPNVHIHWSVPDPARTGTNAAFRDVLDELRERVHRLAPLVRLAR